MNVIFMLRPVDGMASVGAAEQRALLDILCNACKASVQMGSRGCDEVSRPIL